MFLQAAMLRKLDGQAAGRIEIAAGGGLRLHNARALAESWQGRSYHGTLGGACDSVDALAERIRRVRNKLECARAEAAFRHGADANHLGG